MSGAVIATKTLTPLLLLRQQDFTIVEIDLKSHKVIRRVCAMNHACTNTLLEKRCRTHKGIDKSLAKGQHRYTKCWLRYDIAGDQIG